MSIRFSAIFRMLAALLVFCGLTSVIPAYANEGGGPVGPIPMKFVVNLGNPARDGHMLAVEMVLDGAPEVNPLIAMFKPKIQHEMILLLSGEDANVLRTVEGKKSLGEKIKETVNKVLKETEKNGVREVLFINFMIQ